MIKLFRTIRKKLIEQDKTTNPAWQASRYLKYAIGEFMLLVIWIMKPKTVLGYLKTVI